MPKQEQFQTHQLQKGKEYKTIAGLIVFLLIPERNIKGEELSCITTANIAKNQTLGKYLGTARECGITSTHTDSHIFQLPKNLRRRYRCEKIAISNDLGRTLRLVTDNSQSSSGESRGRGRTKR